MENVVFNTKQEIIKCVEENSSYRFTEEKNNIIIFNNKRGDKKTIKYVIEGKKVKIVEDSVTLKPLGLSKL